MGVYNTFGKNAIQLKAGDDDDLCMAQYNVGDKVLLQDGIYVAYEGFVVVKDGKMIAEFESNQIFDKWGSEMSLDLNERNPISQALKSAGFTKE